MFCTFIFIITCFLPTCWNICCLGSCFV